MRKFLIILFATLVLQATPAFADEYSVMVEQIYDALDIVDNLDDTSIDMIDEVLLSAADYYNEGQIDLAVEALLPALELLDGFITDGDY